MNTNEHMKDIPNFPNYSATLDGRIWSKTSNKFLKVFYNDRGYCHIFLFNNGKRKHYRLNRAVYAAFCGEIPNGYEIHHKNEVRDDNRLENLELVTHKENMNKGDHNLRCTIGKLNYWKNNPEHKQSLAEKRYKPITLTCVEDCGKYNFKSNKEAYEFFGVTMGNFSKKIHQMRKKKSNRIKLHGIEYIVKEA